MKALKAIKSLAEKGTRPSTDELFILSSYCKLIAQDNYVRVSKPDSRMVVDLLNQHDELAEACWSYLPDLISTVLLNIGFNDLTDVPKLITVELSNKWMYITGDSDRSAILPQMISELCNYGSTVLITTNTEFIFMRFKESNLSSDGMTFSVYINHPKI
jgi:hypothetical protein